MPVGDPCVLVDALAAAQLEILRRINRKFRALQRLARLLEQLGDLSSLIPNIAALIPVIQINLDLYQQLVANCPYLNLPSVSTGDINQLRAYVQAAYANFFNRLLRHPWNRMGKLQEEMARFEGQINSVFGQAGDFLRCLQTICATGKAVAGQIEAMKNVNISKEVETFAENYVKNAGKVLSQGAINKYNELVSTMNQLRDLGADVGRDYVAVKQAAGGV
jgi:hypothetical protein